MKTYNGYSEDGHFFKMGHDDFRDYCGTLIATGLFKGKFEEELNKVINMAVARGMKIEYNINQKKK